jgi:hypothetical protein
MAVPRPVLIAILGLALCVTALIAVHGVGTEEDTVAPTLPPATTPATTAKPSTTQTSGKKPSTTTKDKSGNSTQETAGKVDSKPVQQAGEQAAKPAVNQSAKERTLAAVKKDLEAGEKTLVLFFTRPGAADDTGARSAVRKLHGIDGVKVYSPNFDDLSEYRPVLAGVGVSQVPSIVIVKPGKKAVQVVEGYVDAKSLRQQVTDATR